MASGTGGSDERAEKHPSVGAGLRTTVLVLVGVLLLAGVATAAALMAVNNQADTVRVQWAPLDENNDAMRQLVTQAQADLRTDIITRSPAAGSHLDATVASFEDTADEAIELADDDAEVTASIEEQRAMFQGWVRIAAEPAVAQALSDPATALVLTTEEPALNRIQGFTDANEDTEGLISVRRETAREAVQDGLRVMLVVVAAVVVGGLIVALVRAIQLRRGLTGPLRDLSTTLGRLGSGDLDARAKVAGFAEVRAVVESVNDLADENQRLSLRQARRIDQERQGRRLAASLHEHLDLRRILALAGAAIGESLHVDRVVFHLATETGFGPPRLEWRAAGVPALADANREPLPRNHPLVQPLYELGTTAIADAAADGVDPRLRDLLIAMASRSVLAVPLPAGDDIVGIVVVHEMMETRTWLPTDIDLIQIIADELGTAIRHAQLYEAKEHMVAQLRELDEVKSDFVSSVSHELRTPLTSVMGYLEMLRDREAGPLTPEQDRMLDVVERNTERLLELIEDLLALARIESGRFKVVPNPIELPPLVDSTLDAIRPEIAKRDLRLIVDVPPGLPLVLGDVRQLERVLLNLLSNAVKFTPKGGQVRVTLAPRVRSVMVEVADTGLGIPAEEQTKLFTRFFRSSVSQQHSVPGTGLGLMIVKAVVDSHGGTIAVRSAEGRGTAVTVSLPAVPAGTPVEVGAR